jgi:hypothetical protein
MDLDVDGKKMLNKLLVDSDLSVNQASNESIDNLTQGLLNNSLLSIPSNTEISKDTSSIDTIELTRKQKVTPIHSAMASPSPKKRRLVLEPRPSNIVPGAQHSLDVRSLFTYEKSLKLINILVVSTNIDKKEIENS